jgi:hypothetical protein
MSLPKFEQKVADMVDQAVKGSNPVMRGIVTNSYYGTTDGKENGSIFLDVIVTTGDGSVVEQLSAVPYVRTWGVQSSLPPKGASALMLTNGDKKNGTYAIAIFDSSIVAGQTTDNETPDTLPKAML